MPRADICCQIAVDDASVKTSAQVAKRTQDDNSGQADVRVFLASSVSNKLVSSIIFAGSTKTPWRCRRTSAKCMFCHVLLYTVMLT